MTGIRLVGLGFVLAGSLGACAASSGSSPSDDGGTGCPVGAETCACTTGGACDPGLECLSGICVDPNSSPTGSGGASVGGSGPGPGPGAGGGTPCLEGCKKIDMLFAVDHSASMQAEVNALAAQQAFTDVVNTLASINCGDIDFRIGLTDDNDRGFIVPPNWNGSGPWFDSTEVSVGTIATNFEQAVQSLFSGPATPQGCEHVLSSATNLLVNDGTGFLRDDALLVIVLVTDVDDYGEYDQGVVDCGAFGQFQGCTTPPPPLNTLHDMLLSLKNNEPAGLAAIVVAGDPNVQAGVNFCNQPASCCGPLDCDEAFHADRLWAFAGLQSGSNGYVANICNGPQSVPAAVKDALENNIDLACQLYEPPK